ncbi:hypothetical protein R3P38DRAFT_2811971 [Favolaschia claudopus]|uniref:Integrase core domain-containing protein n=1 Tax=Favolaschia claudopus TaxID=2862362 RepID=A0AAV9Z7Q4_9AGAR
MFRVFLQQQSRSDTKKEALEAVTIVETPASHCCRWCCWLRRDSLWPAHPRRCLGIHLSDEVERRFYKNRYRSKKKTFARYAKNLASSHTQIRKTDLSQKTAHHRTELNKKIYRIGLASDDANALTESDVTKKFITSMGGFPHYGIVSQRYLTTKKWRETVDVHGRAICAALIHFRSLVHREFYDPPEFINIRRILRTRANIFPVNAQITSIGKEASENDRLEVLRLNIFDDHPDLFAGLLMEDFALDSKGTFSEDGLLRVGEHGLEGFMAMVDTILDVLPIAHESYYPLLKLFGDLCQQLGNRMSNYNKNYAKKKEAGDKDKKAQDTGERKPKSGYSTRSGRGSQESDSASSDYESVHEFKPNPKPRKRPAPRPAPRPAHSGTPLYKKRKTEPKPPPKTFYSTFAQLEQAASDLEFTYLLQSAVNSFPHPIPERRKSWKEDFEHIKDDKKCWRRVTMIVSRRTLYYHLNHNGLSTARQISLNHPLAGSAIVMGHLEGLNIHDSLWRVDAVGVIVREESTRFMDGNEKLRPWGFYVHGCVDGHSRLIVYLVCCNNKRSATVEALWMAAVAKFGWPSRGRGDFGKENNGVERRMIQHWGDEERITRRTWLSVGRAMPTRREHNATGEGG